MQEQTIFDLLYPKYKITKPIRLIEFFAGYGSQALALKYLGVEFEHWKICEWAIKSIQAYNDLHFGDYNDYSETIDIDEIKKFLLKKGISSNYNEPMTKQQIERMSEPYARKVINNIVATRNLVNIQQVKGKDLEIVDKDKYDYILIYSFPCQDLSLAGKGKGMSDTSTRSGMLWEVERILTECSESDSLPQILLMENVPQVHGAENIEDFKKWIMRLEELGYSNYWQDLIATDYGIPQIRNRCFMVSLLGDYSYSFPPKQELKLKLKDLLEVQVDEKYFLSDDIIRYIAADNDKWTGNNDKAIINKDIASTINTGEGQRRCEASNYISDEFGGGTNLKEVIPNLKGNKALKQTIKQKEVNDTCYIDAYNKVVRKDKAGTITTGVSSRNNTFLAIKNNNSKGYLEATDGDGVDISSRMHHHRGTVQKEKIQTITTSGGNDRGVVVDTLKKDLCNKLIEDGLVEEGDIVKHSYTQKILDGNKKCVEKNDGNMITLTTKGDCVGVCVGTYQYAKSDNFMNGKDRLQIGKETSDTLQTSPKEGVVTIGNYSPSNHNASRIVDQEHSAPTVMENHGTITATQTSDLRIRKLTPREYFRLMGVKDEDFEKIAKNQSDSSLYHLAGDSIVVNVLMAIFKEVL